MPTSVLLAVLAAAGLLALAPALVRRYDATERLVAERAQSTARVLSRRRRRRSVPGRYPVNNSRLLVVTLRAPVPNSRSGPGGQRTAGSASQRAAVQRVRAAGSRAAWADRGTAPDGRAVRLTAPRHPVRRYAPAVYRRRRVFAALLLLNLAELLGVVLVGPGFWSGFSVTAVLLAGYVIHLRNLAIADRRRQRQQAREAAWLAARQAEIRREQARRAAARREVQRRLAEQREAVRRAAGAAGVGLASASYSYRRVGGLRGRAYQAGPPGSRTA